MIPLQEPELAVQEAKRAVAELGHRGLFISPHPVDNRNLDHQAYEPLWQLAEQLNVPALVHVSTGIRLPTAGAERFDRYSLFHLHKIDAAVAAEALATVMAVYSKDGTKPRDAVQKEIDIYREALKITKPFTPEELEDMSQQRRAYELVNR